jgi:4-amino-4-deoxy-L-arabinose transferase-like glycosyltransferase
MSERLLNTIAISAILLLFLISGALYAIYTPDWQAPDEPAHYNYVRQLAGGQLPVIEAADYDQQYIERVVGSGFDPHYSVERFRYEDWQPPLYYLLQTPIYLLSGGSLTALRLFSVVLGTGIVFIAYLTARQLFPARPWLALSVAVFVAFLPQHLAILASVNNDSLAELLIAGILLLLVQMSVARYFAETQYMFGKSHLQARDLPNRVTFNRLLLIGLLLGLGFLTKGTVYLMAPVVGLGLLLHFWGRWNRFIKALLIVFVPALVLGTFWWARNVVVYGELDVLGKAAHDTVVVGQPRTADWITQYGLAETIRRFVQTTFTSFWGQFGWMALPIQGWPYSLSLALSLLAVAGLLLSALFGGATKRTEGTFRSARDDEGEEHSTPSKVALWGTRKLRSAGGQIILILLLMFILTLGLHVWYNLTFVQHQGRYLFPALISIAAGGVAGLAYWLRPMTNRWPAAGYVLPLGLALLLVPLTWYALFSIIVPLL